GLVVHVGELHDMVDLVAEMFQRAPQQVDRNVSAKISDVAVVIDRRAADVEADTLALEIERLERLNRARERVVELEMRARHGSTCRKDNLGQRSSERNPRDQWRITNTPLKSSTARFLPLKQCRKSKEKE